MAIPRHYPSEVADNRNQRLYRLVGCHHGPSGNNKNPSLSIAERVFLFCVFFFLRLAPSDPPKPMRLFKTQSYSLWLAQWQFHARTRTPGKHFQFLRDTGFEKACNQLSMLDTRAWGFTSIRNENSMSQREPLKKRKQRLSLIRWNMVRTRRL